MSASANFVIEKLLGRENYTTWAFAVKNLLQHEDLWDTVQGKYPASGIDHKVDTKAKTKIILLVDKVNYVHIEDAETSKEVWDKLKSAFQDSGLTRRVGLLRQLITASFAACGSVEEYVSQIVSTAHKLKEVDMPVSDEWVGTLLLAGLPEEYAPMIMGIESSGVKITGDAIKTKLLQDVKKPKESSDAAFLAAKKKFHKKRMRCFNCNRIGHIAADCNKKKQTDKKGSGFCTVYVASATNDRDWFIDSGASLHMSMRKEWFTNIRPSTVKEIFVANKEKLAVEGIGDIKFKLFVNGKKADITFYDVLYVPNLSVNLLSVSQIISRGYTVQFRNDKCEVKRGCKVIASATLQNNMFKLDGNNEQMCMAAITHDVATWHSRMGHLNYADMKRTQELVNGMHFNTLPKENCVSCMKGKMSRKPYKSSDTRATEVLELIHSDLCGPMEESSINGAKYFLLFIDDHTRKVFVYFLQAKTEVPALFEQFKARVENETGKRIKCLRTDNGTEYCNKQLSDKLKRYGIQHQTTVPYSPQQNGVAERANRTIVEKARCMLFHSGLPKKFWAEAVANAVYVINRSVSAAIAKNIPQELWTGRKVDLSHLRTFGCRVMAYMPKEKRRKWDAKSKECIFTGYCEETKGYRLLDPDTLLLVKSRDVVFLEREFWRDKFKTTDDDFCFDCFPSAVNSDGTINVDSDGNVDGVDRVNVDPVRNDDASDGTITDSNGTNDDESDDSLEFFEPDDTLTSEDTNVVVNEEISDGTVRRSARTPKPRNISEYYLYTVEAGGYEDPFTIEEALKDVDAKQWRQAMGSEYQSLMQNNTWTLVKLPPGVKPIKCKWVFKKKKDEHGNVIKHKARLVIKGCSQKPGIDFQETYSPVVRYTSIRYLLSIAAQFNLDIEQMDAVTAFLQGDLDEEIFMEPPEGIEGDFDGKVCKLNKAIYGLKQASRQWNKKLDAALKSLNLRQSKMDPCIYYNISGTKIFFIAVYVDDILIFSNNNAYKNKVKSELQKSFSMKDLGTAKNCVGLHITRNRDKGEIYVDQTMHANDFLHRFNMAECKPISTPFDVNVKLKKPEAQSSKTDNIPYQEAIGCLLYLVQGTRPDLAYAVNYLSKFNECFDNTHWSAVKRVFRYLKGTKNATLVFKKNNDGLQIKGFCDADYAGDTTDRRSCTGYVFMQQGAISWNSKRQATVALSTTEAEYMAVSAAVQEAEWLRQFQKEFFGHACRDTVLLQCDNRSAINLANTEAYHARTKHIDVRHHFVRNKIDEGHIELVYESSENMVADFLTKPLSREKHMRCAEMLNLSFV